MTEKQDVKNLNDQLEPVFIDDMLMSLKYYVDEHESHLSIKDQGICIKCPEKVCMTFCPVGVYSVQSNGGTQVSYLACVECGSCRIACPENNINWKYPRGGFGVGYKFG
ncbi:MAG TPA: 4Fe-4S dicluster domain-containing protein [Bellilinea sp.]|nr:4Fe-4S dicluster domain-containing protein [Bellilinea sp.]